MSCFWFGHAMPSTTAEVKKQMRDDKFQCRRCGRMVKWADMPKVVQSMRVEYLRRTTV